MKNLTYRYKADLLLTIIFLIFAGILEYYYPVAQLTWDGDSYIQYSQSLIPNIRPLGYSIFLRVLYMFSHSLSFVVYCQLFIYFSAILFLLKVIDRYCQLSMVQYCLLGICLLVEPAALYHCITILSDMLFAGLTYAYLATLLLYINTKKTIALNSHIIITFLCIETRHVGLFFPFITIAFLVLYLKDLRLILINTISILIVLFCVYIASVAWNYKIYGVKTYSAFSGWTAANNALYVLPHVKLDPKNIEDPEIRELHTFFTAYLDTTSYKPYEIGSGYLWDQKSPLNVIRKSVDDSLIKKRGYGDFYLTWFILAPRYEKYGSYIARKFPEAYAIGFVLTNLSTLIKPQGMEMLDYYMAKNDISAGSLKRYGLTANMLYCRQQIYKDYLNAISLLYYQISLLLFLAAVLYLFIFRSLLDKGTRRTLFVLCAFTVVYYLTMLPSSSFSLRYLLPVLPILVVPVFIAVITIIRRIKVQNQVD